MPLALVIQPTAEEYTYAHAGQVRRGTTLGVTDDGEPGCRYKADRRRETDLDHRRPRLSAPAR
jgi:hypothetical protein